MTTTLTIMLPPAGFQRPRPSGSGQGYYSPHHNQLLDWQQLIKNQMRLSGDPIIEGPLAVRLAIGARGTTIELLPVLGDQPKRPRGVRQDLDNIVKFVNDALQGYAYLDDRQIVELSARFVGE